MPRRRAVTRIAFVCAAALAAAGCSGSQALFDNKNEGGLFSKPLDVFAKPDWARPSSQTVQLGPSGPVGPEDLVGADGSCAAATVSVAPAAPAEQTGSAPAAQASANPVTDPGAATHHVGGIALGMSECQAVRRAGQPTNVSIGADEKGERKTVITYLTGTWPGIYTFNSGRLKEIERAPEPPKPAKPAPKKKPKTAAVQ